MRAHWTLRIVAIVSLPAALTLAPGCASQIQRGSVVMKIDDETAHASFGNKDVGVGDRLVVYDNRCRPKGGTSKTTHFPPNCRLVRVGEARVVETLNDHYSVIELEPGVTAKEGQIVEKE